MFNNAGRLKVNMGNIYFKLGQFAKAIKFYRMALDQVCKRFLFVDFRSGVMEVVSGSQHS